MIKLIGKQIIFNFELNDFNDIQDNNLTIKRKKMLNQDYIIDLEYKTLQDVYDIIFECEWSYLYLLSYRENTKISINKKYCPTSTNFNYYTNKLKWFSNSNDDLLKINESKIKSGIVNFNLQPTNIFENMFDSCVKFCLFVSEMNILANELKLNNCETFINEKFYLSNYFKESLLFFNNYVENKKFDLAFESINKIIKTFINELKQIELYKNNFFNIDYPEIESEPIGFNDIEFLDFLNKYNQNSILNIDFYNLFNCLYYFKNTFLRIREEEYNKNQEEHRFQSEIQLYNEWKTLSNEYVENKSFIDDNLILNSFFSTTLKRFITYCNNDEIENAKNIIDFLYIKIITELNFIKDYKNNFFNISFNDYGFNNKLDKNKIDDFYFEFYEKYSDKSIFEIDLDEFIFSILFLKNEFIDYQKNKLIAFHKNFPEIIIIKNLILNLNKIITLSNFKSLNDFDINTTDVKVIMQLGEIIKDICDNFVTLFEISELTINDKRHTTTNYISFPSPQSTTDLNLFSDLNVLIGMVKKSIEIKYHLEKNKSEKLNFDCFYQTGNIYIYTKLVKCLDALRYFYVKF